MLNTIRVDYSGKKLNLGVGAQGNRQQLGYAGETAVAYLIRSLGLKVTQYPIGYGYDLEYTRKTGEKIKVEVKTARQGRDGKYRFTLYKKNHTNHLFSDFIILLAVVEHGETIPYIIPVNEVDNQNQAVITSHPDKYNGKLNKFKWVMLPQ